MAVSKVVLNNNGVQETLIDVSQDTVTQSDVAEGVTFHNAQGVQQTGTATGGANLGSLYADSNQTYYAQDDGYDGYDTVTVDVPSSANVTSLFVDQNGTYDATMDGYDGYDTVEVDVQPNLGDETFTSNGVYDAQDYGYEGFGGVTVDVPLTQKTITSNGTYYASSDSVEGYDEVIVNVSGGATLGTKTVTTNGTYNASSDSLDGYSSVTVNVPNIFQMYVNDRQGSGVGVFQDAQFSDSDYATLMNGIVVTDMNSMFMGSSVENAPLFDTSAVTDASYAFDSCISLISLPLYNFSNVTNINSMFEFCDQLTVIPAYNFSNVSSAANTFDSCSALEEINITGMHVDFDISASDQFTTIALRTIINNLGDVATDGNPHTGGYTAILTMGSINLSQLSQSDIDAATAKGWTLT